MYTLIFLGAKHLPRPKLLVTFRWNKMVIKWNDDVKLVCGAKLLAYTFSSDDGGPCSCYYLAV